MALVVLSRQARWSDLEAMIEDRIEAAFDVIVANADPALVNERRGYIKALREFLHLARTAPDVMAKQGATVPL